MARNTSNLDHLLEELSTLKHTVADMVRKRAGAAGDTIRSAANGAGAMVADTSDEGRRALRDTIRAHPLASLATAFSLGLSFARLFRR